jgi:hypothetical protein
MHFHAAPDDTYASHVVVVLNIGEVGLNRRYRLLTLSYAEQSGSTQEADEMILLWYVYQ